MDSLTKGVGARIRLYRKKKRLSLTDLSRLTGIAASNLSSIELNKTSPTLNTLIKIADAFEMKAGALLDEMLYGPAVFCPASAARPKDSQKPGVSIEALTDHVQKPEMLVRTITVASNTTPFVLDSQGDTFIYCIHGTAAIVAHSAAYTLRPGDGLYVRAFTDTECRAAGQDQVVLLAVSNP
jgi:transcriptional regulator with XRE-family HTH domain|uniref:XRE family transcriptional regulator n=1 Tax=Desulfomonile tiedjei TaxID=2358 RepID=A0A7C4AQJ3_9BACT